MVSAGVQNKIYLPNYRSNNRYRYLPTYIKITCVFCEHQPASFASVGKFLPLQCSMHHAPYSNLKNIADSKGKSNEEFAI